MLARKFRSVWIAVAVVPTSFGLLAGPALGASAPVSLRCSGVDGDVAGVVGAAPQTSKQLVGLLGTVTKSDGLPPLPASVESDVPARVKMNSGDPTVSFTYNIVLDDATRKLLKDTLGKSAVDVRNAVAAIDYSGAASGTFQGSVAIQTLDLGGSGAASVSMSGKFPTTVPGRIQFKGGNVSFSLDVNASIAGMAQVGTLTVTCSAVGTVASTTVQIPGAPIVPDVIDGPQVTGGQSAAVQIIDRPDILPDAGNPIVPGSLKILNGAPGATISGGTLIQPTDPAGGTYTSELQICAAPRALPAIPDTDEVQTLTWAGSYRPGSGLEALNAHPLGMKLSFGGQETAEIPLSTVESGSDVFGRFAPPSAQALQSALEALPSIGPGNVRVVLNPNGTYSITLTGALGGRPQPEITLSGWRTHLDYSIYEMIQDLIGKLTAPPAADPGGGDGGGGGGPDLSATDLRLDQLWDQLMAGTISWDQFTQKFGKALINSILASVSISQINDLLKQIFPQKPTILITLNGEPGAPGSAAAELCSSFTVSIVATAAPHLVSSSGCLVTKTAVPVKAWVRKVYRARIIKVRKKVIGLRTTRTGAKCPKTFSYNKRRGLTITRMLPTLVPQTAKPRKARLRVTAKRVKKAYVRTVRVKRTADGYTISGRFTLPKAYRKARSIRLTVSGGGMQTSTRTVRRS